MQLTFWQRIHRRYAHWRDGSYTYPDGTVEHAYERQAGINVFHDSESMRRIKLHRMRIREHGRERFSGAWIAAASIISFLRQESPVGFWTTAACIGGMMAGLFLMTKPFYPPSEN